MDISIIIINFNTKELTGNCLTSIYEKVKDLSFEVIVVDNNSQDSSCDYIRREFPQVKLIKNSENRGFAFANNIAIRNSKAKYVFLLNSDTVLLNNSPGQFFEFMEKHENHNIGVCGGKLYNRDMKYIHSYSSLPSLKNILFKIYIRNTILEKIKKIFPSLKANSEPFCNREVGYITGANMFIRKSVLDDVGLFDEDFFLYFEDTELSYRIAENKYKSVLLADVKIIHLGGNIRPDDLVKVKYLIKSELKYFEKIKVKFKLKFLIKYLILLRYLLLPDFDLHYLKRIKFLFRVIFQQKV